MMVGQEQEQGTLQVIDLAHFFVEFAYYIDMGKVAVVVETWKSD